MSKKEDRGPARTSPISHVRPDCVVLAGGLGTRMLPKTETIPKVLLPVAGRPFLAWQLRLLFSAGVGRVVLSVGHMAEKVAEFLHSSGPFEGPVDLVADGDELLGTGGAVRRVLDLGKVGGQFLLTFGDSFLPIDHAAVFSRFHASQKPALMTVFRNEGKWDTSNVAYADGMVNLYDKTRSHPGILAATSGRGFEYIDYGLSALTAEVVREAFPAGQKGDLATMFHALSLRGDLAGFEASERFYEIGSPQGLDDLEERLSREAGFPLFAIPADSRPD